MSRSITLSMPPLRVVVLGLAAVIGAVIIFVLAVRVGAALFSPSPAMEIARTSEVQEVVVVGGGVYLGRVTSDEGGYLRLEAPAVVRQESAGQGSAATPTTRTVVQVLSSDPFAVAGAIVLPREQVVLVASVLDGSALRQAYDDALAGGDPSSASPSPSP